ncbi:cation:dicarboxylate symporter family transporter [Corallincola spongiicola]|uniref:Cation:dicarboxylase symporter family transporter n=1 Tax=Corallincola spongiicola TaxID=2520508 RepID=A0ABY1WNB4_9GAMM|nr:cation:dicarboxylase symporter family transporter [Corallincola spongiicola]TAA45054.1 cation:dicarboxylase symporter family transporter [Corallincola spongiicola]
MKFKLSLSSLILLAMFAGIGVGLFFGEMVGWMEWVGTGVILLMQMTILPYVTVSLISGIGRLEGKAAKLLFSQAGIVMLIIWGMALVGILVLPLAFPEVTTASFFSTSVITSPPPVNYYDLYIPANPFKSLAIGAIPAVVIFSIALGISFINMEGREPVIAFMDVVGKGLSRVTNFMVKTLPVGVFASAAGAAGTLTVDEFASLQVFLVAYALLCLALSLWLFPAMVAAITPFSYREVMSLSRDSLITAFATGNIFIVLPVLIEGSKKLFAEKNLTRADTDGNLDVLLPIAFTFPNAGKLTVIFFVLFCGWFTGKDVSITAYPMLAMSGLLSLFGSVHAAIPFMLNSLQLPSDLYQLFLVSSFITGKFNSLVAVMHLLIFGLLTTALIQKQWLVTTRDLLKAGGMVLAGLVLMIVSARIISSVIISESGNTAELLGNMRVVNEVSTEIQDQYPDLSTASAPAANLQSIIQRGVLRVGYLPNNAPFTYFNQQNKLVGLDISLINTFAQELGVEIELIPYDPKRLDITLNQGHIDIAISGIAMDATLMGKMNFTDPILQLHLALVAKDYRLKDFSTVQKLREAGELKVAIVGQEKLAERIQAARPDITLFQLTNYQAYFEQPKEIYDALLISAEAGYAWSMLYPDYGVILPEGTDYEFPMAFATARGNYSMLVYLNSWITLKKTEGLIDKEYEFWILGKGAKEDRPRWSVIRDYLGWVN